MEMKEWLIFGCKYVGTVTSVTNINKLGLSCAKLRIVELKIEKIRLICQNEFSQNVLHEKDLKLIS